MNEKHATLEITATARTKRPVLPYLDIKNHILGKKYDLSLAFIGSTRSRTLNKTYRGKDRPTNVLSFPLSETAGEICIDLNLAKKQAPRFNMGYRQFIAYLFIHGLLHLKGMDHGDTMEKAEKKALSRFSLIEG